MTELISTPPLPIDFGESGLVPIVTQDATSSAVLMVGFMNAEALSQTRETGLVHYWSRSRATLWLKGGTSGHVQRVQNIYVNCDDNSLLIKVDQVGAVCHTGYPTCFYRRLEDNNSLTVVRDRWFDPEDVYGDGMGLEGTTRRWWHAFEILRDADLTAESGSSRLLHAPDDQITPRIIDELQELAGVLDGTHVHDGETSDAALEGGQVCYWLAMRSVWSGAGWDQVRPDKALNPPTITDVPGNSTLAILLRAQAVLWDALDGRESSTLAHETFALVAASLVRSGIDPLSVIRTDLASLESRPYLAPLLSLAKS